MIYSFSTSVDGNWSAYGAYSKCSADCGGGTKTRKRTCSNQIPQHGGRNCVGDNKQTITCNTQHCPSTRFYFSIFYFYQKWQYITDPVLYERNGCILPNCILLYPKLFRHFKQCFVTLGGVDPPVGVEGILKGRRISVKAIFETKNGFNPLNQNCAL